MTRLDTLQRELERLHATAREIRDQGVIRYPSDFVLDSFSRGDKTYYRKRPRLPDGKPGKPEYISPALHAELGALLANGRRLHRVEVAIARVQARIDATYGAISRLGGTAQS